jgi:sugar O-acyltransferase (sialic acid O-acetyltransferase NeuD family)
MYLYGASGHCKVIIDSLLQSNNVVIEGVIDDNPKSDFVFDVPVIKTCNFKITKDKQFIVSVGNNAIRKKLVNQLQVTFVSSLHPRAIVSNRSSVGLGTVIMAGVIINADVSIGNHCIVNTGAVIDHDCHLDDFVHISPNASLAGGIEVGEGTQIGIGASIIQGIKIGKWVTIGAGAVILKNVPDYAVVVGNPGRIIKYNNENHE